jgi:hypothetical protein
VSLVDTQVNFLRLELRTGKTMLAIAYTEQSMGDPQGVDQAITNARKALKTAKLFLPLVKSVSAETLGELERGVKDLQDAVEVFTSTEH